MNPLLWFFYFLRGLTVAAHPDYLFDPDNASPFYAGDIAPLKWSVTRKDGTTPDNPISATIHVLDSGRALVDTLTPDLDPSPPSGSLVLAALWTVRPAGNYTAQLTITMPADGQVRSGLNKLLVR